MRLRKTLAFFTLAMALVFALPAWAQQKSVGPSGAGPRPNAVRPYVACAALKGGAWSFYIYSTVLGLAYHYYVDRPT
ncbi:MAG: hypothetical protein ABSF45_08730 [Terriglobia bacterium]|jgi:hypothetical protein